MRRAMVAGNDYKAMAGIGCIDNRRRDTFERMRYPFWPVRRIEYAGGQLFPAARAAV